MSMAQHDCTYAWARDLQCLCKLIHWEACKLLFLDVLTPKKVMKPSISLVELNWIDTSLNVGGDLFYNNPFIHDGWVYVDTMNLKPYECRYLSSLHEESRWQLWIQNQVHWKFCVNGKTNLIIWLGIVIYNRQMGRTNQPIHQFLCWMIATLLPRNQLTSCFAPTTGTHILNTYSPQAITLNLVDSRSRSSHASCSIWRAPK